MNRCSCSCQVTRQLGHTTRYQSTFSVRYPVQPLPDTTSKTVHVPGVHCPTKRLPSRPPVELPFLTSVIWPPVSRRPRIEPVIRNLTDCMEVLHEGRLRPQIPLHNYVYFVDVIFFTNGDGFFMPREIATTSQDGIVKKCWLVKTPSDDRSTASWYDDSLDEVERIRKEINRITGGRRIFAGGFSRNFMQAFLGRPVENIGPESRVLDKLRTMWWREPCANHAGMSTTSIENRLGPHCALNNCLAMTKLI